MESRKYFSVRTGLNNSKYNLDMLKKLFKNTFDLFESEHYFDESIGFYCVDQGFVEGYIGNNVERYLLKKLRKVSIWPIDTYYASYNEDDIFDLIEVFFDIVSEPVDGDYHSWQNCGMHYSTFNKVKGQQRFRNEINEFLCDYEDGWELNESGEIVLIGDLGLSNLFKADIPYIDETNITDKMKVAILKFRRHKSTLNERNDAVRELADILEFIRPNVKENLLTKDEAELFIIANNFGIRHHNLKQKKDYDSAIWLSWVFYIYLSTIHLILRLMNKEKF